MPQAAIIATTTRRTITSPHPIADGVHVVAGATGVEPHASVGLMQFVGASRLNGLWLVYVAGPELGSAVPDVPYLAGCDLDARFRWVWGVSPLWTDPAGCGSSSSSCTYRVVDPDAVGAVFEVSVAPSALEGGVRLYGASSAAQVTTVAGSAP